MVKRVLGKGLEAIISNSTSPVEDLEKGITEELDRIVEIDIHRIKPNPDQPRTHFDEEEIRNLSESIQSVGLLQPIIVRKAGNEYFVIAGERRLRASKLAGIKKIRSIIVEANEEQNLTFALIENIQRAALDPIEEAKAYRVLINRFKIKQNDIAQKVGKDRTTISNLLRLLNLPDEIQQAITGGQLSAGHAKALLSMPKHKQMSVYREIIEKGMSVRAVEKLSDEKEDDDGSPKKKSPRDPHIRQMEEKLVSILGTKVEIKHSGDKGQILIHYYSLDDFDRIIEILQ
ncbi:MAG TPA: ParB/RepB/Spo0J family partition protein [Spirochaetota bacterium]|nr:ParB/RepB/Spo0J family partition protein [Spirochaetota bacterium]HQO02659.1 ParB/RepB/Spo0J family partition protein [Spirochaetota bacterium]HQP47092.1 ParB/RepB/Spo0J family partition protein [Spirochaetota bacterium]